jgi:hypothetical protein
MKPYELHIINGDGKPESIKALAIIAFEMENPKQAKLHMYDNPEIPEKWWRDVITNMYLQLDVAMAKRRIRFSEEK